jgi:hypothetical protein
MFGLSGELEMIQKEAVTAWKYLENDFVFLKSSMLRLTEQLYDTLWLCSLNWLYKLKNLAFGFTSVKERRIIVLHYMKKYVHV